MEHAHVLAHLLLHLLLPHQLLHHHQLLHQLLLLQDVDAETSVVVALLIVSASYKT
jgi:hypothetical protein